MKQQSIYGGNDPGSQDSARGTIAPFQRVEISLTPDRTNGLRIPEIEGEFLYVERSDYPAYIQLVGGGATFREAFIAVEGVEIRAPFKGIILSHPAIIQSNSGQDNVLSLIVSKSGVVTNNLGDAQSRYAPPYRVVLTSAAVTRINIQVPRNVRRIKRLNMRGQTTGTVTKAIISSALINYITQAGAVMTGPAGFTVTPDFGAAVTYTNAAVLSEQFQPVESAISATVTNYSATLMDIPIPAGVFEVQIELNLVNAAAAPSLNANLYYS